MPGRQYTKPSLFPPVHRHPRKKQRGWPFDPRNRNSYPIRGGTVRDPSGRRGGDALWQEEDGTMCRGAFPFDGYPALPFDERIAGIGLYPDGVRLWKEAVRDLAPRDLVEIRDRVIEELLEPTEPPPGRRGAERKNMARQAGLGAVTDDKLRDAIKFFGEHPDLVEEAMRLVKKVTRDLEKIGLAMPGGIGDGDLWCALHWFNDDFARDVLRVRKLQRGLTGMEVSRLARRWPLINPGWWRSGCTAFLEATGAPPPGQLPRDKPGLHFGELLSAAWYVKCNRKLKGTPDYRHAIEKATGRPAAFKWKKDSIADCKPSGVRRINSMLALAQKLGPCT